MFVDRQTKNRAEIILAAATHYFSAMKGLKGSTHMSSNSPQG